MVELLKKINLAISIGNLPIATKSVKEIINKNKKLTAEEKEAFSATFKNSIGEKKDMRTQLVEIIDDKRTNQVDKTVAEAVKKEVEAEMKILCDEVFTLLNKIRSMHSKSFDASDEVFYKKLEADFTRYLIEILPEAERKEKIKKCQALYESGLKIAKEKLKVSDNLRLRLVMNYGIFGDEWMSDEKSKAAAKQEVERTFNEALVQIEKLTEEDFLKTASILSEMDELAKKTVA